MDRQLKEQTLRVIKGMLVFTAIMTLVLFIVALIFPKYKALSLIIGLFLGILAGIINISLIAVNLEMSLDKKKLGAGLSMSGGYFVRLIISALVLILAAKVDYINLFTTAIGLVSPQIVIFLGRLMKKF